MSTEEKPFRIIRIDSNMTNPAVGKLYRRENPFMVFVESGTAEIDIQISHVHLQKNSLLISAPRSVHRIVSVSPDFKGYLLIYYPSYLQRLGLKLNKLKIFQHFRAHLKETTLLPEEEMRLLCSQINNICHIPERFNYGDEITDHLFAALIYTLAGALLRQEETGRNRLTRPEEITFRFIQEVSEFFRTERSLSYYAQRQHMTVRHLSAVVKQVTGKSAQQILAEFLLNEARLLLERTKLTISEIAADLRFSDAYAFSHFFKKQTGNSPTEYRRQN